MSSLFLNVLAVVSAVLGVTVAVVSIWKMAAPLKYWVLLISFFFIICSLMALTSDLNRAFSCQVNISSSRFIAEGGMGNASHMYEINGSFAGEACRDECVVVLFTRAVDHKFFSLQTDGWPPTSATQYFINGNSEAWNISPVFIGDNAATPDQKEFEIYAVGLQKKDIDKLFSDMEDKNGVKYTSSLNSLRTIIPQHCSSSPYLI